MLGWTAMKESEGHLLIIEDDADLLQIYRSICAEAGVTCDTASLGFEGLDLFRAGSYDLVILDLELPDVKGDNLIREFLKDKAAPPVIVVTGFGSAERAREVTRAGAFQLIRKPFDPLELRAAIHSGLRRHRLAQSGVTGDELFELREVALLMREDSSRLEVLQSILNSALRLTSASSGSIMLWEPQDRCLIVERIKNLPTEALGQRVPFGSRVSGKVFEEGVPVRIAGSVRNDPKYPGAAGRKDVQCSLCIPASVRGVPIGVLNLNSSVSEDFFSDRDLRVASIFAADAATFLSHFDLTDQLRKKVEELEEAHKSVQTMSERLATTEKMSSLGLLAGGIAHQFNNLLAIIQSNLEMITLDMVDPKAAVAKALGASKRAAEVAEGMLTFARDMGRTDRTQLSLSDTFNKLLLITGKEFEAAQIQVIHEFPDPSLKVEASPGELQEIFMNLLLNAREAMQDGGELRIAVRRESETALVEFVDTGHGIDQDTLSHMFDPFFTTKPQGTGLGLWRVYNLINSMGGSIEATSSIGKGTRFALSIPLSKAAHVT